tara:strand:- start:26271 stop:27731 length:1461 start_codon:yes stop_codon:yes gene_type:complete
MRKYTANFFLIITILVLSACSTTEDTITVIQDAPRAVAVQDTVADSEEFFQLNIGVLDPITSFDPLYAENLSSQRVISLIYETLYSLNDEGDAVPSIATSVEISENGLEYLFTIDRNVFFQESQIFTAGLGRRIHAQDIKWAFERSARSGLPPHAAELLMGITGFENYYLEQREVFDQEARVLEEVIGIRVIDSNRILFVLNERDPDFLKKLASPFLSIYPSEAFAQSRDGLRNRAVGTGAYKLDRIEDDGRIVLIRDNSENRVNRADPPAINRIDVTPFSSESDLFQEFTNGNIDWIPEIGPEIMGQVLDNEYNILPSYDENYEIIRHPADRVTAFYLHEPSITPKKWLISRLALLTEEDFMIPGTITLQNQEFPISENAEPQEQYFVAYTENLQARALLSEMNGLVFQPSSSLVFFDIRIPTRRTSIYSLSSDSYHENSIILPADYWLKLDSEIISLFHRNVDGIQNSTTPWDLQINNITVIDE